MSSSRSQASKESRPFKRRHGFAFAAPSIAVTFLMGPIALVQGIYAMHYGVALTAIAAVLLISRLFDAVTDPLIGYLSDRSRARSGTRKPFIFAGGISLVICSYFLFIPSGNVSIVYFAGWSLAFYLAATVYNIPLMAWASEMTADPKDRTLLFTLLLGVGQVGGLLFYLVPFLPIFATSEITPETLKVSVLIGAVLMLPSLYISLRFAPNGHAPIEKNPAKPSVYDAGRQFIAAVKNNRPFQLFVAAYMCLGLGLGMWAGLFFIYVDAFLGLGDQFATISVAGMVIGLLITPVCYKLTTLLGKRTTWMISSCVVLFGVFYTGTLNPGDATVIHLLILQTILIAGGVFGGVIAPAMLSDTIDYGALVDGVDRNGLYFSIFTLLVKMQGALGAAMGLALAGWFGFDATAAEQTARGIFGMQLAISWVPLCIASLGLVFIWRTPLNDRRNEIIQRRLAGRIRRVSA